MKSVWKSPWALQKRSHALSPVLNAASVPGTRRGRVGTKKRPSLKFMPSSSQSSSPSSPQRSAFGRSPSSGPGARLGMAQDVLDKLRDGLEASARVQDAGSEDRSTGRRYRAGGDGPPRLDGKKYGLFKKVVGNRYRLLLNNAGKISGLGNLKPMGITRPADLIREAHLFRNIIDKAFELAAQRGITGRQQNPYFWGWRNAFINGGHNALSNELQYSFISFIVRQHLSKDAIACHERLADMRFPHEWFPATRLMQRTIHLHVGPTNSGKTYNALKALEHAQTGIYAGPLRLLAHETFTRFKAKGKRCALVTGEEQRIPEGDESYYASCTVEMTPLNQRVDVAVIDEIQMIGDESRGWAWTQALLGVQAKEVHLCGEERAVPLVQAICAKIGDEVIVHKYKRLSALQPMQESLNNDFQNLRKGDAVVSFSRVNLHSLKAGIEHSTGKKCAIVYGALPPESRAQQAALFNDPNNDYDYLAASDAIGMGLNLEIKRVVFESISKHDGVKIRILTIPELKQIGGRAGRFRTAAQANRVAATSTATELQVSEPVRTQESVGFVTCLDEEDLDVIHSSFDQEAEPLQTAGLFPPPTIIEKFASYFPVGTPFAFMLLRLRDIARLPGRFHMCDLRQTLEIAQQIQPYALSIHDRCVFMNAPVSLKDHNMPQIVRALAKRIATSQSGDLLTIKEIPLEILDFSLVSYPQGQEMYLKHLEGLHKALVLYLWMSYRYAGIFKDQALAFHTKEMVENRINNYLDRLAYDLTARKQRLASQRRAVRKTQYNQDKVLAERPSSGQSSWAEQNSSESALLAELGDNADTPLDTESTRT